MIAKPRPARIPPIVFMGELCAAWETTPTRTAIPRRMNTPENSYSCLVERNSMRSGSTVGRGLSFTKVGFPELLSRRRNSWQ